MEYVAFIAIVLGVALHPKFRHVVFHGFELLVCMSLIGFLSVALAFGLATRDHTLHFTDASGSPVIHAGSR